VLRDSDGPADGEPGEERAPAPGLADLGLLASRTAATGLRLDVTTTGTPQPLPAGVDTAAYRVVQEAVTNVVRHADVSTASVFVRFAADHLEVEVSDAGRGCAGPPRPGFGLVGMRERVQLYGGSLVAGPLPGKGVRVIGRFPVVRLDDPVAHSAPGPAR
jgi:signal transduction histidine kinase